MKEKDLKKEAIITEEKSVKFKIKILIPVKEITPITEIDSEAMIPMLKLFIAIIVIIEETLLKTTTEVSMKEMELIEVSTITIEKEKMKMNQVDI
jgi:hypothetical protein